MSFYQREEIPALITYKTIAGIAITIDKIPSPVQSPGRQKLELQHRIWELDEEIGCTGIDAKFKAELEAHKEELQRQYKKIN